jgi:hypothetical protein
LCQKTSRERRNRSAGTPRSSDKPYCRRLNMAGDKTGEDGLGAWVDRSEKETEKSDRDCVANDIGNEPRHQLEGQTAENEDSNEFLLADRGS